jgi:hypothetical protein
MFKKVKETCFTLCFRKKSSSWAQVAQHVILATQGAEIRRIEVPNQLRQTVQETPSQKIPSQKRAGRATQGVGPEFKPQYCRKERRKEGRNLQNHQN